MLCFDPKRQVSLGRSALKALHSTKMPYIIRMKQLSFPAVYDCPGHRRKDNGFVQDCNRTERYGSSKEKEITYSS